MEKKLEREEAIDLNNQITEELVDAADLLRHVSAPLMADIKKYQKILRESRMSIAREAGVIVDAIKRIGAAMPRTERRQLAEDLVEIIGCLRELDKMASSGILDRLAPLFGRAPRQEDS